MSNNFLRVVQTTDGGSGGFNSDAEIWWCPSVVLAGIQPYVLTVNTNLASGKNLILKCWELSGLTAVDQVGTNNASSGATSTTVTAGGADGGTTDFVVSAVYSGSIGLSDPPGTSNPTAFTSSYFFSNGTVDFDIGHRINAASVTDNANWTWTNASSYAAVIASFKGSPTIVKNLAGIRVSSTTISMTFPALPIATDAIVVAVLASPWNPAFSITNVTDNQTQSYVPMGGLPQVEMHWRDG